MGGIGTYPKIELHVHLEGTVRARTLLEIAKRNDYPLPDDPYRFEGFAGFLKTFERAAGALRRYDDFRRIVVEYAEEAARHGAVYLEAIFVPGMWRGIDQDEVFSGYCDGAREARELHGVETRLTPDVPAIYTPEQAETVATFAVKYRGRGVVGLGLAGPVGHPVEPFARAFAIAREGGLGSVPHAGEHDGPASMRTMLEGLAADRLRHGIRAVDDPGLVRELADRGTVLDVCPLSNVRTGAVASLAEHPLPQLAAAGVRCSISTDDPAMFDTDLSRDYEAATSFGLSPRSFYDAGVAGALCDEETRARLQRIGDQHPWQ